MFDFKRIITGLLILVLVLLSYYLTLDKIFLIFLFFAILYDLLFSKIIKKISNYYILIIFLLVFSLFLYFDYLFLIFLLLFLLISLSLFHKTNLNLYFIFVVFISFFLLTKLNIYSRSTFYLVFFLSFINDTFALIIGRTLKGPKIVSQISPNKTWSGTISSFLLTYLTLVFLDFSVIFSFFASMSFFISDIYFSYIKRINKLKDFSNLLNNHGGLLDRLDSILLPSVLFFFNIFYL